MKYLMYGLLAMIIIVIIAFFTGGLDLAVTKFFGVRKANIQREIFEQSKSYTHGKIQDLAKYYEEHQTSEDKQSIESLIKMNFSDFDANKINALKLRQFLINVRGY